MAAADWRDPTELLNYYRRAAYEANLYPRQTTGTYLFIFSTSAPPSRVRTPCALTPIRCLRSSGLPRPSLTYPSPSLLPPALCDPPLSLLTTDSPDGIPPPPRPPLALYLLVR